MVDISTAANPSPFDPIDRMPANEPRFVIRGTDPAGPGAITEWARLRRMWAIRLFGLEKGGEAERMLKAELEQCKEADELAIEWSDRQHGAEPVEGQTVHYSGVTLTEEQVAAAKRQKNQVELVRHLREAAYFACEIIEGDGPAADVALVEFHAEINNIANRIEYGARPKAEAA